MVPKNGRTGSEKHESLRQVQVKNILEGGLELQKCTGN